MSLPKFVSYITFLYLTPYSMTFRLVNFTQNSVGDSILDGTDQQSVSGTSNRTDTVHHTIQWHPPLTAGLGAMCTRVVSK